ncbi:phage holin family protein [Caldalkalibacillus mannanilyticus]|uniref:phage holin family protein n=1 Tax=Caldalkalibacillus mannanilyticus TaxID=1418 RepID=UPI000469354C|nr:phage holin family protein [Caldalkalibacillus mannanilyticus]
MNLLLRLAGNWATLMIVAGYLEGFTIEGVTVALLAAIILAIINAVVKPIIIFFTLPITILTFGLFLLVVNAITLMLAQTFIAGFTIDSFLTAFVAGIIISVLNYLIQKVIIDRIRR